MIKMKSILAENMLRYGTKNLTEAQKRRLMEVVKKSPDPLKDVELKKYLVNWWKNAEKTKDFSFTPYITKNYAIGRGTDEPVDGNETIVRFSIFHVVPVTVQGTSMQYVLPGVYNSTLILNVGTDANQFGRVSLEGGGTLGDYDSYVDSNELKQTGEADVPSQIAGWLTGNFDPASSSTIVGTTAMKQYLELIKPEFASYATETKKSSEWATIYSKVKYYGALMILGYKP